MTTQQPESRTRDYGTAELRQHHLVTYDETSEVKKRARVLTSAPCDYYLHRRNITQQQWEASEKLFFFWYHGAERSNYVTVRNPHEPSGGKGDPDSKIILEQKYNAAIKALPNAVIRLLVINVVCHGEYLATVNHLAIGKNARMEKLRDALDILAKHFGIPAS